MPNILARGGQRPSWDAPLSAMFPTIASAVPLLVALSSSGCRERTGQEQGSVSASSASAGEPTAPVAKPFRIVAKVRASGWAPITDAGAPHNPEAERRIREHLQGAHFASSLRRCYSDQPLTLPVDTTVFLSFDREGKVTRAVLEGVPTAVAPCVNALYGGLRIPDFALANASPEGGTLSGVMDVQAL